MSRSLKCFNPTCKCGNIELERVLKIRCRNCHCSITYDIEKINFRNYEVEVGITRTSLGNFKLIRDQQNT